MYEFPFIKKVLVGLISKMLVRQVTPKPLKAEASHSFKRVLLLFRVLVSELYTAPKKIFVNLNRNVEYSSSGKLKTIFHVGYVGYTNRCIPKLIIQDENNMVRWYCGMTEQEVLDWMGESQRGIWLL